jgi:hypothetical protein
MPAYLLNLPLIIFIAVTFLLEIMHVGNASNLVISGFLSFFSLGVISASVSQRYKQKVDLKKVQFYNGLLAAILILSIGNGIIHWYKLFPLTTRTIIFFTLLLIFLVILIRAVRTLNLIVKTLK